MNTLRSSPFRRLLPRQLKLLGRRWLTDEFHRYYYRSGAWKRASWLGVPVQQYPGDLLVLQEIVWETRPTAVVETGTLFGGTALYFASLFDLIGEGTVVSVDIDHSRINPRVRAHPRIALLKGDSRSVETFETVRDLVSHERVMVHLDADHARASVLQELRLFGDLVAPSCYVVVADSNTGGHPVPRYYAGDGGPHEAIHEFLQERDDFVSDRSREYHLVTFAPDGFLARRPRR